MGSGSLNAMAMFESKYKDDMTREEACALVADAIRSGVMNDLGSGSNIDLCVITKDGVDYMRNKEYLQGKTYSRQFPQKLATGTASKLMSELERRRLFMTHFPANQLSLSFPLYLLQLY
jgi:20S proteasome subunit beta 2